MSDITAVVLTIGEDTTDRAVESVKRQTVPAKEIVVIRDVTPFYAALNLAAAKVKTEFFVQVDSDMVLDDNCFEALRQCMQPNVGLAMGHLRDPLVGRISSVKMFRTSCFEQTCFRDSVAQDVDFRADIGRRGWATVYAINFHSGLSADCWHTFGEHRPNYDFHYTFCKYLVEGRRYRYRQELGGLRWHFRILRTSRHSAAMVARIAMAHGIFIDADTDLLKPYAQNEDFTWLAGFLETRGTRRVRATTLSLFLTWRPEAAFRKHYRLGIKLRRANAFPTFQRCLRSLGVSHDPLSWIAGVALSHGLFARDYREDSMASEYHKLEDLLKDYSFAFILKEKVKCLVEASYEWLRRLAQQWRTESLRAG